MGMSLSVELRNSTDTETVVLRSIGLELAGAVIFEDVLDADAPERSGRP